MIRIIYHSADFDGHASGAIARYYFEKMKTPFTMHPYNYGQEFPFDKFDSGDELFFLDVTYQPNEEMMNFEADYRWSIYICDHHKTVVESDMINYITGGILDMNFSGCELTWKYFFPHDKVPKAIELLGRYDIWDHSDQIRWDREIYPFQMGFHLLETSPNYDKAYYKTWERLFSFDDRQMENFVSAYIEKGETVLLYQKNINKKAMMWLAEELKFDGYKAIVANSFIKNSQIFDSIWDEKKYDIMLVYSRSKYDVGVSIYTTKDDIDCSEIAKKHGGGGHKKAAGFGAKDVVIENGVIDFINI